LPSGAVLAGIDEETALVKHGETWSVAGVGAVTIYGGEGSVTYTAGATVEGLPG
jgi:cyanophycinase-like exopeptidase